MPATRSADGMSWHRNRPTWHQMLRRCYVETSEDYQWYGARGIRVDERWHSLKNFIDDVGRKPSPIHHLDRINNDGDYGPGNTRWVTPKENQNNKRNTVKMIYKGELRILEEIAADIGIHKQTLRHRLARGDADPFRAKAYRAAPAPAKEAP